MEPQFLSIWGGFENEDQIAELNAAVHKQTGGVRPLFMPHITLLGSQKHLSVQAAIEAVEKVIKQCHLKAVPVSFRELALGGHPYQCVFLEVGPVDRFTEIHQALIHCGCREHGIEYTSGLPFHPHVSIAYGDSYRGESKRVESELHAVTSAFKVDPEELSRNNIASIQDGEHKLLLNRLMVVNCPLGDITEWSVIEEIPLVRNQDSQP
eukprot:Protomagalhaensia_wolfi_Nauph_80__5577@NODE_621_length_2194_cov_32_589327_g466_i0_p2_GENE_NODE_621_length_2194_cov_32_589327_g466_i0NODE_621_length_2194_cov_32_589327_g466_i0_p2_ORF_typecomplete_len209_score28_08CPDase/PF07823_11/5e212_5_RNA_ligase2/PF13563_6/0_582_5_RNA_ligase2/PF13563_6/1_5e11Corona_NS2A/PF05213_12/0_17_NODE_621_length_2194_cov_32_589327_g466_i05761202